MVKSTFLLLSLLIGFSTSVSIGEDSCESRYLTCSHGGIVKGDISSWKERNLTGRRMQDFLQFYCKTSVPFYLACAQCAAPPNQPSALCLRTKPMEKYMRALVPEQEVDIMCVRHWMNYHEHCLVPLYEPPEKGSILTAIVQCYLQYDDFDKCGKLARMGMVIRAAYMAPLGSKLNVKLPLRPKKKRNWQNEWI